MMMMGMVGMGTGAGGDEGIDIFDWYELRSSVFFSFSFSFSGVWLVVFLVFMMRVVWVVWVVMRGENHDD